MLPFREDEDWEPSAIFYSGVSLLVLSGILYHLLSTGEYLNVGTSRIYPIFMILIISEILKYCLLIMFMKFPDIKERSVVNIICEMNFVKSVARRFFTLLLSCLGFYIMIVIFGAEILNKQRETLMLSVLLTIIAALPVVFQPWQKYDSFVPEEEVKQNTFESLIFNNAKGAIIGTWLGAFVIPLDWDRPWQQWPISCFMGALFGSTIINYIYFAKLMFVKINRKLSIFDVDKNKYI